MRPIVIVDESHNANTKLSTDMLNNLNPSFVLDLTATPKENSNVISYVNATALVKEDMVKLPVIVYNKEDEQSVFVEAKVLRDRLEQRAIQQHNNGGDYVRPIVLLQAESKTNEDSTDYEKVRQTLIDLGISKDQIKIKTANIDELKGIDLLSPDCQVRYIITINALKEGWDCSFAYILATFANRSSETDVTQLLGRVLRKPFARKQKEIPLECSYVITASKKFNSTLEQLSSSLEMIGFGGKDIKAPAEDVDMVGNTEQSENSIFELSPQENTSTITTVSSSESNKGNIQSNENENNTTTIENSDSFTQITNIVTTYQNEAQKQDLEEINRQVVEQQDGVKNGTIKMNDYKMKDEFKKAVLSLQLPQFVIKVQNNGFFDSGEDHNEPLKRAFLLKDFKLANQDSNINIENIENDIWQLNVDETENGNDSTLVVSRLKQKDIQDLIQQVAQMTDTSQINQIESSIFNSFAKKAFYPVDDADLRSYIKKIATSWTREQRIASIKNLPKVAFLFKAKIDSLMNSFASDQFKFFVNSSQIKVQPSFKLLPKLSIPSVLPLTYEYQLYDKEAEANSLEKSFITELVGLDNIYWWHRNLNRGKGFAINGYLTNHYPDFIIMTKSKHVILLETKGNMLDGSDSKYKLQLGTTWANLSNSMIPLSDYRFKYFMVFEKQTDLDNAYTFDQVLKVIRSL